MALGRPNVTFTINDESLVNLAAETFSSTNGGIYSNFKALGYLGTTAEQTDGVYFIPTLTDWYGRLSDRIVALQGGTTFAQGNTYYSIGKCAASIADGTYTGFTLDSSPQGATMWSESFRTEWWAVHNFLQYGSGCYVGFKTDGASFASGAFLEAQYDILFQGSTFAGMTGVIDNRSSGDRPVIAIVSVPGITESGLTYSGSVTALIPSSTAVKEYVRIYGSKVHLNSSGSGTVTTNLTPDVAGCLVRTDRDAYPWFSPAGVKRGRILNVVRLSHPVGSASQDLLYDNGVNFAVTFVGEGTLLYGDRTGEAATSTLSRINVSRLFMYIKKALAPVARAVLFEQNDAVTRASFKLSAETFLSRIQSQRGLSEFKVICDTSNNPPQIVEANYFVADILIKPITAINYIKITLTNKDLEDTIS